MLVQLKHLSVFSINKEDYIYIPDIDLELRIIELLEKDIDNASFKTVDRDGKEYNISLVEDSREDFIDSLEDKNMRHEYLLFRKIKLNF